MRYYYRTYDPLFGFDSIFNDLFGSWSDSGRRYPPVDVYETDEAYVIEMEVCGYDEEAIKMHVDKHVLTISGEEGKEEEEREYTQGRYTHLSSGEASHFQRMRMKEQSALITRTACCL